MKSKPWLKIWHLVLISLLVTAGCFSVIPHPVLALGISPPWVINHDLLRGSHFEKIVHINQGAPKEPLSAKVDITEVPSEFKDWITIQPGLEFTVPVVQLFPVTVSIDVPPDAELKDYKGKIRITLLPEKKAGVQVTVGMAVGIDLDLKVVEKEVRLFNVALWGVKPMEEGWPVKIGFTIENKGNVEVLPFKARVEVYDEKRLKLFGSGEDTKLEGVAAFTRGEIIGEFPIKLAEGFYWAKVKLYKDETEAIDYEGPFPVLRKGALGRQETKGKLSWWLKGIGITLALAVVVVLWLTIGRKIFAVFRRRLQRARKKFKKVMKVLKEKE